MSSMRRDQAVEHSSFYDLFRVADGKIAEHWDTIECVPAPSEWNVESALRIYHPLLRPGGYFAFTEAVWRKEDPPSDVKASFAEYPGMGRARDVLAKIDESDFSLVGHFTLPNEDWWDEFYTPMELRIEQLRTKYSGDAEAQAVLEQIAEEPKMHGRSSDYYAYEFFVVRAKVQLAGKMFRRPAR
ncbi:MAG: hypothetical protein JRH11_26115 [Deltaproteobacteria bacterium]|nr:hypothetical protein [Deltaproteobacteria bacterium]